MSTFDPVTSTEDWDEQREGPAAKIGDEILERAALCNRIFYEETTAGRWWFTDKTGEWKGRPNSLVDTYLKRCGVNAVRDDKHTNSDLDLAKLHIAQNYSVVYAGPLAGHNKGVQRNNGNPVLVTRSPQIPTPDESISDPYTGWPHLNQLLEGMLGQQDGDDSLDQLPYFLAYIKHSLQCLMDPDPESDTRGLAVVLAGEAGCGKSLLKMIIRQMFGGRECKPYQFMIGQEKFNGDCLGAELWAIDDEQASTDARSRSEFGANIKKVVADDLYRLRGMHRDGASLVFFKRLLICVNREPERLMVLPQLDDDIGGKMSIFLCHSHPMPMKAGSREEKSTFWRTLMVELPGFIHWLLEVWEHPKELLEGRFGAQEFHHPDLCRDLFEMSREHTLMDQLQKVLFADYDSAMDPSGWYRELTASALRDALTAEDAPLTKGEKNHIPLPSFFGKCLAKIEREHPERIRKRRSNGKTTWLVAVDDEVKGHHTEGAIQLIIAARRHKGGN